MLWLLLFGLVAFLLYIHNYKTYKYWDNKGATQWSNYPLLATNFNSFSGRKHLYEVVTRIYSKFPNLRYIGLHHFTFPILMLRDPQLIKQMNVRDYDYFIDRKAFIPEGSDPMWDKNLIALKGQRWKDMRSAWSPLFTGSKIRQMYLLMNECSKNFLNHLTANPNEVQEVELKDIFARYTIDIIATTAFGIQCDSLKDPENEVYIKVKKTTDFTRLWKMLRILLTIMVPSLKKVIKGEMFDLDVSNFFRKVVKETLNYREKNNIDRPDMINVLMRARKGTQIVDEQEKIEETNFAAVQLQETKHRKGKIDLSLDDITAQSLTFFFGGFDSVSTVMCFMGYELAIHPDIQQKLIEELDEFRTSSEQFSYEGLARLNYLDMVVSETLRKWPPNIVVDRQCVKPYTIEPQHPDEKPINLTPNDTIWIPIWAIHYDPKYWEDPDKFDPDRFTAENRRKIIPYTYLPFGVGPRNCIGYRFALIELKSIFYALLSQFEIVPTEKSCVPFVPNRRSYNLAAANGFWFGLKKRRRSEL